MDLQWWVDTIQSKEVYNVIESEGVNDVHPFDWKGITEEVVQDSLKYMNKNLSRCIDINSHEWRAKAVTDMYNISGGGWPNGIKHSANFPTSSASSIARIIIDGNTSVYEKNNT